MVEFFDFGERNIDLGMARDSPCRNQLRQPVQSLRTKYYIYIWRALHDIRPFLTGDTTAHAYKQVRVGGFKMPDASQIVEDFSCAFAHRTGIEQDHIGRAGSFVFSMPCAWCEASPPSFPSRTRSSGSQMFVYKVF